VIPVTGEASLLKPNCFGQEKPKMNISTNDQYVDRTSPNADQDEASFGADVVLRLGAIMLGAGASTNAIERVMRSTGAAIGLQRPTAVVTFNTILLSYSPRPAISPNYGHPTRVRTVR
jgi:hypothetical protein